MREAEPNKPDNRGEARQSFFIKQQLIEGARTAFQLLSAVIKNASLYPEAHPFLMTSADKFRLKIESLLLGRKDVAFYLVGGEFFFEKVSVPIDASLAALMEQFATREIGGIIFNPGLTSQEMIHFASLLGKETLPAAGGIQDAIRKAGISHIELHRVMLVDKDATGALKEGAKAAADLFQDAVHAIKDLAQAIHLDKSSSMRRMNTIVQTMVDSILDSRDALMGLTSIKMYDEYTFAHSVNTAILAVSLGNYLSFEKAQIAALGMAALMHDIGKVRISRDIINKPGKLNDEEWEHVKRHPIEGALILSEIPGVSKLAMVAAFEHHQHCSGKGYPGFIGECKQHPFSQIVALVDAYEALTAPRVYYSVQIQQSDAIRILLRKGNNSFHPALLKAFINMVGLFPIGSVLRLDTGEIGLVMHQTRDLMRPRVLLLTAFDGSERKTGVEVSLLETHGGQYRRSIVSTINPRDARIDVKQYLA